MDELGHRHIAYNKEIKVGCMIEIPSAAIVAEHLAKESAFISIGTNDLIQFTLAVDRTNEKIAAKFEPHHPAVLKLIHSIIKAGRKSRIPVSICGEMAGNPLSALLLIGMNVEELSMRPASILEMKKFIRSITLEEAKVSAKKCLKMSSAQEVNNYLQTEFGSRIESLDLPPHKPLDRLK